MNLISEPPKHFFVELPIDDSWGTRFPKQVFEGKRTHDQNHIKVLHSSSIPWSPLPECWFAEIGGPARKLTFMDYLALLHPRLRDFPLPIGFGIRLERYRSSSLDTQPRHCYLARARFKGRSKVVTWIESSSKTASSDVEMTEQK
jgi:hypothetical protein